MLPSLDFLIPAYERSSLSTAVESIYRQIARKNTWHRHSITVADDASCLGDVDGRLARLKSDFPFIDLYRRPVNLGMSANLYQLAFQSDADFLFVLTDDDRLLPGVLDRLDHLLEEAEDTGVGCLVSPRQVRTESEKLITVEPRMLSGARTWPPSATNSMRTAHMAHVLSGLLLRKSAINFSSWSKVHGNAYFPLHVVGEIARTTGIAYHPDPTVHHTVDNKVFWSRWGESSSEIELRLYHDYHRVLHDLSTENNGRSSRESLPMFLATCKQLIRLEVSRSLNVRSREYSLPPGPLSYKRTRKLIRISALLMRRPLKLLQLLISYSKVQRFRTVLKDR